MVWWGYTDAEMLGFEVWPLLSTPRLLFQTDGPGGQQQGQAHSQMHGDAPMGVLIHQSLALFKILSQAN